MPNSQAPASSSTPTPKKTTVVKIAWLLVLALAIASSFFTAIHSLPLFDLDEGAYAEATREMFERGNFLATYLNGEPRYDKPILFYWLQAISVSLLGWNELALRLPSALGASAWALATAAFVGRLRGFTSGCLAGTILSLSLLIGFIGKAAIPDAILNFLISSTMFLIFLYQLEAKPRYLYLAYAGMGLGFLTKGPVAVLIPLVVSLLFYLSMGQWRQWLKAAVNGRGWLIFAAIALPWYLAILIIEGPGFLEGFFLTHNLGRFSQAMEGHGGSIFYYLPIILIGTLPFTGLFGPLLKQGRQLIRDPLQRYLLIWFLFVLVLFSLASTKLPHYINYGLTGLIILLALQTDRIRCQVCALAPAALFFLLLFLIPDIIALTIDDVDHAFYRASLQHYDHFFDWRYRLACLTGLLFTIALIRIERIRLRNRLLLSAFLVAFAMPLLLMPRIAAMLQEPTREAGQLVARTNPPTVVRWRLNMPSFSVYSQRVVSDRPARVGDLIYTTPAYLDPAMDYDIIFHKGGIVLARLKGKKTGAEANARQTASPPAQ